MGIFEDLHGASSADAFARKLKRLALRYYGAPLRAWLQFLITDIVGSKEALRKFRAEFLEQHLPQGASGEVSRASQRFAIIGAAGELATQAGITGVREGECMNAAGRCFKSWISNRGTIGAVDELAAIRQVRHILERDGDSRFQDLSTNGDKTYPVRERIGFRRFNSKTQEMEYLVLKEAFKTELCAGYDYSSVCKALDGRHYLVREDKHWTIQPGRLPGFSRKVRVFCIRAAILR